MDNLLTDVENMHEKFMKLALREADKSARRGEVPVGAVVVKDGQVIARGRNDKEEKKNPLGHAEINAIHRASKKLGAWRLEGCTLYVTLEPCPMCAGAIQQARLDAVVFGARDPKHGAMGSITNLFEIEGLNHYPRLVSGVLEEECSKKLSDFFVGLRERNRSLREKKDK